MRRRCCAVCTEVVMRVERISSQPTERYPWTHRLDFGDTKLGILWGDIQSWSQQMEIPGVWVLNDFYTNQQGATMMVLKWS
jgi:hypothetical protein